MRNHEIATQLQPFTYERFSAMASVTGYFLRGMSSQIFVDCLLFHKMLDRTDVWKADSERLEQWSQHMSAIQDSVQRIGFQSGVLCYPYMNDDREKTVNKCEHWRSYDVEARDQLFQDLHETLRPDIGKIATSIRDLDVSEAWSAIPVLNGQTLKSFAVERVDSIATCLARIQASIDQKSL